MFYFSPAFLSSGFVMLLVALLAYQNNELKNELELARSETKSCIALSKSSVSPLPPGQVDSAFSQSSQSTACNASDHLHTPPDAAPDLAQSPVKPAPAEQKNTVSPAMTSLQDVFQKKTTADSQPISTVSPLGTGVWGAGAQ